MSKQYGYIAGQRPVDSTPLNILEEAEPCKYPHSAIADATQQLFEALRTLSDSVNALKLRLVPVMLPSQPTAGVLAGETGDSPHSPHRNDLTLFARSVMAASDEIDELTDRLEI